MNAQHSNHADELSWEHMDDSADDDSLGSGSASTASGDWNLQTKMKAMEHDMTVMQEKMEGVMAVNSLLVFGTQNLRAVAVSIGSVPGGSRGLVCAARAIQRILRGSFALHRFLWCSASAKRIQAHSRTWKARNQLRKNQAAVNRIASTVRRRMQSLRLSERRAAAVTVIASRWRGYSILTATTIGKMLSCARQLEAIKRQLANSKQVVSRAEVNETEYCIKNLSTGQLLTSSGTAGNQSPVYSRRPQ